jgi:hypothetical protein
MITVMARGKAAEHERKPPPPAKPRAAPEPDTASVLPMDLQVGDRFTAEGFEWEVLTHPTAMHGAKKLRARVVRPGVPETEREVTCPAHQRVTIRRPRSAA